MDNSPDQCEAARMVMVSASLYLNATDQHWLLAVGGLFLLGLTLVIQGYRRQTGPANVRLLCASLKLLALALLLSLLLEPVWTGESPRPGANDFLTLTDNGEGLAAIGGDSVLAPLKGSDTSPPDWYEDLDELFRMESFSADTRLRKIEGPGRVDLDGQRSDFIHALEGLEQRFARRPLAGVLLFTDGNATDASLLDMWTPQVPIYPVLLESEETFRDLALGRVSITQTSFEDAPVTITASMKAVDLKGKPCFIVLRDAEGEEILRERHVPQLDDEDHTFRLRFRPIESGLSFHEVSVEPEDEKLKEVTDRNNTRTIIVDRGRGPYRVLYITGRPNWEYKFLQRAISGDDEIDLVGLIRVAKKEPKFVWRGRRGEDSNPLFRGFDSDLPEEVRAYDQPVLIRLNTRDAEELRDGFPLEREDLFPDWDAIVLDDLEADFFTGDQQLLVEKFISLRGGSLLMLGGQESLQLGGWQQTPVGEMLPVYLDRPASTKPIVNSRMKLTREGLLEPWARLRLTEEEEDIRLAHMPPFKVLNELRAIKPGASVVATVVDEDRQEFPALAVQRFGEGRTAALTIGDIWRWGMKEPERREDMEQFWRQLMRWLVVDVPDFIRVETEWESETGLPRRRIEVRVRNDAWRAEENATIELLVKQPGKEEPARVFAEPSLDEPGLFVADIASPEPGAWQVTALVDDDQGVRLGQAEAGWTWNPAQDEYASLAPNRRLLEELAEVSGGKMLAMEELRDFVRELPDLEVPVTESWSRPIWHQPWILGAAILLFAGEWGLRRWKGLT